MPNQNICITNSTGADKRPEPTTDIEFTYPFSDSRMAFSFYQNDRGWESFLSLESGFGNFYPSS